MTSDRLRILLNELFLRDTACIAEARAQLADLGQRIARERAKSAAATTHFLL